MQFNFVVNANDRAVRLWESLGFKIVGRLLIELPSVQLVSPMPEIQAPVIGEIAGAISASYVTQSNSAIRRSLIHRHPDRNHVALEELVEMNTTEYCVTRDARRYEEDRPRDC